jgi:hypothetical protein
VATFTIGVDGVEFAAETALKPHTCGDRTSGEPLAATGSQEIILAYIEPCTKSMHSCSESVLSSVTHTCEADH